MDRRQKKTREAIFEAFTELLSNKHFNKITVGEIIELADVGRATFYAHFETKDFLLKELCRELFCHIFDSLEKGNKNHKHIFDCDAPSSVILHLLQHLQKNDNNILLLLSCENNELFLRYFKESFMSLMNIEPNIFESEHKASLPDTYWNSYVANTFVETVRWWVDNGLKETPQTIADYLSVVLK